MQWRQPEVGIFQSALTDLEYCPDWLDRED